MNFVFVTPEFVTENNYDGGLANFVYKAAQSLILEGHQVVVITLSPQNGSLIHDNIQVFRVKFPMKFPLLLDRASKGILNGPVMWLMMSYKLNKQLRKIMKLRDISYVQYSSYTAPGIFRPKKIKSIVRISSLNDLWDEAYGVKKRIANKLKSYLENIAVKNADYVYGPSAIIGKEVEKRSGKPVHIIAGPIKTEFKMDFSFYEKKLKGKKYFLFYGTIGLLKGVKEISDILPRILSLDESLNFVFIGKDQGFEDRAMKDYVLEKAGRHFERVLFFPSQSHESLYPVISNSLAVVLPSRIDNLPNTCTESMSLKRIVIGTRGASFEQLIEDGISGFLCDIANSESLLEKLKIVLYLEPKEAKLIEENAFLRMQELAPERFSNKLLRFITNES